MNLKCRVVILILIVSNSALTCSQPAIANMESCDATTPRQLERDKVHVQRCKISGPWDGRRLNLKLENLKCVD